MDNKFGIISAEEARQKMEWKRQQDQLLINIKEQEALEQVSAMIQAFAEQGHDHITLRAIDIHFNFPFTILWESQKIEEILEDAGYQVIKTAERCIKGTHTYTISWKK